MSADLKPAYIQKPQLRKDHQKPTIMSPPLCCYARESSTTSNPAAAEAAQQHLEHTSRAHRWPSGSFTSWFHPPAVVLELLVVQVGEGGGGVGPGTLEAAAVGVAAAQGVGAAQGHDLLQGGGAGALRESRNLHGTSKASVPVVRVAAGLGGALSELSEDYRAVRTLSPRAIEWLQQVWMLGALPRVATWWPGKQAPGRHQAVARHQSTARPAYRRAHRQRPPPGR
jgi:hypothetical protein